MNIQRSLCLEQWRSGIRYVLFSLVLLGSQAALALELSNSFVGKDTPVKAGFWWDEDDPGWNVAVHFAGEQMIVVWSTYTAEGKAVWYMGQGSKQNDTWEIPLRQHRWDVAEARYGGATDVGSLTLTFDGLLSGTMAWELGGESGELALEPFILTDTLTDADRTGLWFEPSNPGYGLAVQTQGSWDMTMVYLYDNEGNPTWALGHNRGMLGAQTIELTNFTGSCPGCSRGPARLSKGVGELNRTFANNRSATMNLSMADEQIEWSVDQAQIALLSETTSSRTHPAALASFRSEAALISYMAEGLLGRGCYSCLEGVDFSPRPAGIAAPESSTTNLQEAGVDEADEVKTDGEYLYVVASETLETGEHELRVMTLADGDASEVSRVAFGMPDYAGFGGMYLLASNGNALDTLVVLRSGFSGVYTDDLIWPGPWSWIDSSTEVIFFDVSDPTNPQQTAQMEIDGGLFTTRRVEDTLYAILRFTPGLRPEDEQSGAVDPQSLLPRVVINGEDRGPILDFDDALLPPQPEGDRHADMVLFVPINLSDPQEKPQAQAVVGQSEAIYFSPEAGYLATTRYAYPVNFAIQAISYPPRIETEIHKFAIDATNVTYQGTGTVPGHLGWGFNERSFRMGEHNGDLRVVSSSQTMWPDHEHRVSVLREGRDQTLEEVSHLPNDARPERIGKPGELLYSTRFMGDRLYAVSFRNVDPLYVIDMVDPADPFIAGELEITGFSEYLHVLPDDLLLGFGKNASPAEVSGDGGTFSWFQGLQLSLFDVSDPSNPTIVQRVDFGRRGSDSPLLYDHHAFSILPGNDTRPARVAIPVSVHDAATPEEVVEDDPTFYYPWQYAGLEMIEVVSGPQPALEALEPLITHSAEAGDDRPYDDKQRSVLVGDTAYYISRGEVWASPWGRGDEAVGPR